MENLKAYSYIRFSTPDQKKGDSERRQIALTENWCFKNGYILDDQMKDEGLSAFTGRHKTKGALGSFLNLVKTGRIEKGSVLIVESMDRLSREQPMTALNQFIDLVNNSIRLVTLYPAGDYTTDNLNDNIGLLMSAISDMDRAHKESSRKSQMLKASWQARRQNIDNKIPTGRCPNWLKPNKDRTGFLEIPEHGEVLRKMYDMYLNGKGVSVIVRELNQIPDIWKPKKGWRKPTVAKYLKDIMVIGYYQPCKLVNGKKVPIGEPIKNYYPKVVDPDIYYAVQDLIKKNRQKIKGGRTGKVSNLFTYIAKCGYCGGAMHIVDKGKPPKGATYLVCDNAKRNNGCKYVSWRYKDFEKDLIKLISFELDLDQLLPDHEKIKGEIFSLKIKLPSIDAQISELNDKIDNLVQIISITSDRWTQVKLTSSMEEIRDKAEGLEQEKTAIKQRINDLKGINGNTQKRLNDLKQTFELMNTTDDKTRIDLRFKLKQMVRELVDQIFVFPNGIENEGRKFRVYTVDLKNCKSIARYPDGKVYTVQVSSVPAGDLKGSYQVNIG